MFSCVWSLSGKDVLHLLVDVDVALRLPHAVADLPLPLDAGIGMFISSLELSFECSRIFLQFFLSLVLPRSPSPPPRRRSPSPRRYSPPIQRRYSPSPLPPQKRRFSSSPTKRSSPGAKRRPSRSPKRRSSPAQRRRTPPSSTSPPRHRRSPMLPSVRPSRDTRSPVAAASRLSPSPANRSRTVRGSTSPQGRFETSSTSPCSQRRQSPSHSGKPIRRVSRTPEPRNNQR